MDGTLAARGETPTTFGERCILKTSAASLFLGQAAFVFVAPCPRGASLVSVPRHTSTTDR